VNRPSVWTTGTDTTPTEGANAVGVANGDAAMGSRHMPFAVLPHPFDLVTGSWQ